MAESDGLRDLQMRESRHDRVGVAFGEAEERLAQRREIAGKRVDRAAEPEPQVGRHLVVA